MQVKGWVSRLEIAIIARDGIMRQLRGPPSLPRLTLEYHEAYYAQVSRRFPFRVLVFVLKRLERVSLFLFTTQLLRRHTTLSATTWTLLGEQAQNRDWNETNIKYWGK